MTVKEKTEAGIEVVQQTMTTFLATARADNAFGEPIEHEGRLILPASEVLVGMGFGAGYGSGTEEEVESESVEGAETASRGEGGGGGGGGRTLSRPVAVIVAGSDGVKVEPILDVTKIGVTLLTALGAMAVAFSRILKQASDHE
ncbi:MAG: GerW family sporulation protein [Anaerolineales bacterium]